MYGVRGMGKLFAWMMPLVLSLVVAPSAWGYSINGFDVDIDCWAGAGANESFLVVDFEATGGDSHVFGYRWDEPAKTGKDMCDAIAAAGLLDYQATYYAAWNAWFVDNFSYGTEVGDPDLYWAYFTGAADSAGVQWSMAGGSFSARTLTNGSFDGWYNGFGGGQPRVPEPATLVLLGLAGCVQMRKRRRCGIGVHRREASRASADRR